nr:TIM barrel protein [Xylanivirga thermophila]
MKTIKFGPSGNSDSFYEQGHKSSIDMPKWLHDMGLNAYEYPCTRGVNIKRETAQKLGFEAQKHDIFLSIHAPYYINLAAQDQHKQEKNKQYLLDSLQAAQWMGAKRVVFHPGSCGKLNREKAMDLAITSLEKILEDAEPFIKQGISLCPETMGKQNQLGILDEVLYICSLHESLLPTIDFGHINALGNGSIKSKQDYTYILDQIQHRLKDERAYKFHVHFSRIEYTKAGEKKHCTLSDIQYGPEFEPLAELLAERELHPVIVCESRNNMAEDALKLKKIFEEKIHLVN